MPKIDETTTLAGDTAIIGRTVAELARGVVGTSERHTGTEGNSVSGTGVYGSSLTGTGVYGVIDPSGQASRRAQPPERAIGVWGIGPIAGRFEGLVEIIGGDLFVNGVSFLGLQKDVDAMWPVLNAMRPSGPVVRPSGRKEYEPDAW